jgi:predicted dehydrogenase
MKSPKNINMKKNYKPNRRQFIGSTAAGALAMSGIMSSTSRAAEDKIKIGVIGCGWYGMVNMKAAFKVGGVECIALCDVDSDHLKLNADMVEGMQDSRPKTFKDYRKMLETPGLQAVIIATPPHWHALQFIDALDAGLDIYCEKPLAYDIREGQAMVKAAQNSKRVIQIGFQRRQSAAIQEVKDFVQQGNLGRIVQADVQIHYSAKMLDATPQAPPATLDWELWCGPAKKLPYSPQVGHRSWRLEKEYGNGHLVDWGIHMIDATRLILNEKMPKSIQASGGIYFHKEHITTPDILTAYFDFETCPVNWRHRLWGAKEYAPEVSNGIFLYGEKGTVFVSDRRWVFIPKEKDTEKQVHEAQTDMGKLHMAEFLEAVKSRQQPSCTTEDASFTTATVQLGMISYESQERIEWDLASKKITNSKKAAKMLKRPYRSPWIHPAENG